MSLTTLLYKESLEIGIFFTALPIILNKYNSPYTNIAVVILICLIIFYRYTPFNKRVKDNVMISPAQGVITNVNRIKDKYFISIFLSVFDEHFQIYPINGEVIDRKYDKTGKFNLVISADKSRDNEKKIHKLKTKYGNILVTQIAGFLPRRINSDKKLGRVQAGEYLGIIKFGSRVDLLFPTNKFKLNIKKGQHINIGDLIGKYE
jgi:phosphatidylserine decarboxylase